MKERTGSQDVVVVKSVSKAYEGFLAVDDVSFTIHRGRIVGLVGPNGAGKTTIVECIEGLRSPSSGRVRVLGMDPALQRMKLFRRVGVLLQEGSMYSRIRTLEALRLFAGFHDDPVDPAQFIETFGLGGREWTLFKDLSGGEKRRLLLAIAMVGSPELLILDEPTTGLDPHARRNIWGILREARTTGLTVLVTTHYLEEAEEHCDEVAIMDQGVLLDLGSPHDLLRRHHARTKICISGAVNLTARDLVDGHPVSHVDRIGDRLLILGDGDEFQDGVVRQATSKGVPMHDIEVRRATLEDLYLMRTGREYVDE